MQAKDITDHALGRALHDIAEYGAGKLFAEVAFEIAQENNLLTNKNHLDTTSLSVQGVYDVEDNPKVIEVTHGFSKDHWPISAETKTKRRKGYITRPTWKANSKSNIAVDFSDTGRGWTCTIL